MGFVAFGLRPLTKYFTLNFELLIENYMAECRHFRYELIISLVRGILIVKFMALSPPGGAKHEKSQIFHNLLLILLQHMWGKPNACMVIMFMNPLPNL